MASTLVRKGICRPEEVTEFLDSRMGRHLADRMGGAETLEEIYRIARKHGPEHVRHWRQHRPDLND